jgi:hypothetical protein
MLFFILFVLCNALLRRVQILLKADEISQLIIFYLSGIRRCLHAIDKQVKF